ncbi:MAG: magnesium-translocating P-type ATPase [Pseudonocardiales bacterium]|nr:MAG: magnesium-translocating P-type ATPase [Pseudonocardiales bacterium]
MTTKTGTARRDDPADAGPLLGIPVSEAAALPTTQVLNGLGSTPAGLDADEAARRLTLVGPNAVRTHHAQPLRILGRQLRSPVLILLAVTAFISFFLGQRTDTVVIGVILLASVGLGFVNEYRAERATDALHSQVTHRAVTLRGATPVEVDVTALVPGDVVRLALGEVVPADLRLLTTTGLECDESVLTGESLPAEKSVPPVAAGCALGDLTCCAFMGTVVRAGAGTGVVVATGARAEFGRIALGLGERQPETDFQAGLRHFSVLLLQVAVALTSLILVVNLVLHRPLIQSLLFSLAIAVGITPQLLPAVVSTSLATGSRRLAKLKVLVKRLVCVEDLGDMDVLVTDKTGTLTEGRITFTAALDPDGADSEQALRLGLLSTETDPASGATGAVGGNPLDAALWDAPAAANHPVAGYVRVGLLPFDHDRRMTSTVVRAPDGEQQLVVKGAPESVLARCTTIPPGAEATLRAQFAAGSRVVAVASRAAPKLTVPTPADEDNLTLVGFLIFLDRPKDAAAASLQRLAALGITVKVCTGDNPLVAQKVCADLGLVSGGTLTGAEITGMDDEALTAAAQITTIFARVSPEQKARLITLLRRRGRAVGFLGDGVNYALALHAADVGISVDTATDVAKDAADVVLLEKDLGVLADGVTAGRRIFANTIKYVLMGTSSNFGNMFSAAAASAVLSFLPMLPSQILLNNLLYDASQLAIPTDRVDPEQLQAPSHWDIAFIRRFMVFFGPISSLFDFLTFALMLGAFHAGAALFQAGWFVESLATQTLVIFAIRTRRSPFTRSRPSRPLLLAALATVTIGVVLPLSPLSGILGFASLPLGFFLALAGMVIAYLVLIELAKRLFFAEPEGRLPHLRRRGHQHRIHRRAARFSVSAQQAH